MNRRENLLSLLKRQGYDEVPVEFLLCPDLEKLFRKKTDYIGNYMEYFNMPWKYVDDMKLIDNDTDKYLKYFDSLKPGSKIDYWGVGHEPGSEAAKHMTYMRNPLKQITSMEELENYPFPDFSSANNDHQKKQVEQIREAGLAAVGNMQMTIWEASWYIRGMEELMMDMMFEDEKAVYLLDKISEINLIRAKSFVNAGVDILFIGDDIGMQRSIMMSEDLYVTWLKPRLKNLISEVKKINKDLIVFYHSCGFITPFIPHLIDAGVDVLNPIQPECMDFKDIHSEFGDKLSFHGTIGTQSTMPFGTPEDVRKEVFRNLEIAGDKGGLLVAPTHLLEPEVPWENIIAYVQACKDFLK
ncbi:uroporphyrinogen decarboxylase family protein [Vallitalea guaymasensis]|uniref:Uroporphyrinogen decarboxylase (URO-D) domain-containing protein n=1 Tax=Vallitalea guaymasensis TaxID=1185412 RepID=A0A8J8MF37_9FIRM|nr:uroporphyrinogen decarboxylase family protein [Vallitalea guaymasensis]QUH31752.1 hypothetical protein HYG85_23590 [Vallitalea guaymasensis]